MLIDHHVDPKEENRVREMKQMTFDNGGMANEEEKMEGEEEEEEQKEEMMFYEEVDSVVINETLMCDERGTERTLQ